MISKNHSKLILLVTALAVFLATFNETFLNVAFDAIGSSLSVGFETVQWLATAYMLAAAVMVPISAFLYRRIKTKVLFLSTIAFFIVGSVICGIAQNFILLLVGRVIQAIGSGLIIPIAMNIVLAIAPREKLGSYMGIMGAMTTLGPSLSLIVAGSMLSVADWHVLFWVFGGLSLILFILAFIFLGNVAELGKPKLDALSVALISIALIGILYAISTAFTCWWLALIAAVIGAASLIWFVIRQKQIKEPLINFSPMKNKVFTLGLCINVVTLIMIFALNIVVPKYLIAETGISPLMSSLVLFPAIFISCFTAGISGKIYDKFGPKILIPLGFILMAAFSVLLAFFISSPSIILLAFLYIPIIVGSSFIVGPIQTHSLSFLNGSDSPHGVTIFSTGFQIAGCIGASLFASLYATSVVSMPKASDAFLLIGLLIATVAVIGLILALIINILGKRRTATTEETKTALSNKVADIMITDVYTLNENAPVVEAMHLFTSKKISGCPIVSNDSAFTGFISDGDIFRFLSASHTNFKSVYSFAVTNGVEGHVDEQIKKLINMPLKEIAGKDVFYLEKDQPLSEACSILATTHKKKVPVIENNKIIGIVTRSDITKAVMDYSLHALTHLSSNDTNSQDDTKNKSA